MKYQCLCLVLTEYGVGVVQGGLVHGRLADEPLDVGERHAGRREAAALVVGDDLAAVAPPHGHARVRRPEVDSDRRTVALHGGRHLRNQIDMRSEGEGSSTTTTGRVRVCGRVLGDVMWADELGFEKELFCLRFPLKYSIYLRLMKYSIHFHYGF